MKLPNYGFSNAPKEAIQDVQGRPEAATSLLSVASKGTKRLRLLM